MSVYRLKRVIWRLQEWKKDGRFTEPDLRRAIMLECGTNRVSIWENKKALLELGMIKRIQKNTYKVVTDAPC